MKILLLGEDRIRFEPTAGPITIEAESPETVYSPFHMLASGLATCVYSVLASWAGNADLVADDLTIEIGWSFAEDPHRVGEYHMVLIWPSLPESRRAVAERAAGLCPVHKTLETPTHVTTEIRG